MSTWMIVSILVIAVFVFGSLLWDRLR